MNPKRIWLGSAAAAMVASLLVMPLPQSNADAQLGGLLRSRPSPSPSPSPAGCEQRQNNSVGRSVLRGAIGAATSRVGAVGNFAQFVPLAAVADTLTSAIACRLDNQEQLKAKDATEQVIASETVGASVSWTSESRENVTGTSTIVAIDPEPTPARPAQPARGASRGNAGPTGNPNANANSNATSLASGDGGVGGYRCMLVDDVIIVNGEETREQKRMCRVPPSTRYTLSA